jgi:hypothetical protein
MLRPLALAILVGIPAARAAQAAPQAPTLGSPEEALDRAVHLTWRDDGDSAREYELQRRQRDASGWSGWASLTRIPAAAGSATAHFDDRGVAGSGLAPGEYEYRVRGRHSAAEAGAGVTWSEWSAPGSIALPASCEPPPGTPALPTVAGGDRNGDGRYSGTDLVRALEDCAARGGCILELAAERYDDVAIMLYNGNPFAWCTPSRTACLDLAFPKGLVLQGHGSSTVLRSPVWRTPYRPVPVLEILDRPDIRFAMRNLVLDGRKAEQPDPRPGENDSVSWWHDGFRGWRMAGPVTQSSSDGCLHNLTVRNFMSDGLRLGGAERWAIEFCTVEDIGCHRQISPCPKLRIPESVAPGEATSGYGILIDGHVGALSIRDNRIRRVTKYSIGLKHGPDAALPSIVDPLVTGNEIREAGSIGIFLGGIQGGRIRDNLIDHTQQPNDAGKRANYYDTFGVSCVGRLERTEITDNRILRSAGIGVNWHCSGSGNVLARNRIEGSCRQKNPNTCISGRYGCYDYADLSVGGDVSGGPLRLVDNEVVGTGCSSPLEVGGDRSETEVVIDGGLYGGGPNLRNGARLHGMRVVVMGGAVFEVDLEFDRAARGVVTRSVRVPKVRKDGSGLVLVCSRDAAACAAACRVPEPPAWCSEPEPAR